MSLGRRKSAPSLPGTVADEPCAAMPGPVEKDLVTTAPAQRRQSSGDVAQELSKAARLPGGDQVKRASTAPNLSEPVQAASGSRRRSMSDLQEAASAEPAGVTKSPSRRRRQSVASDGNFNTVQSESEPISPISVASSHRAKRSTGGAISKDALNCGLQWKPEEVAALEAMDVQTVQGVAETANGAVKIDVQLRALCHAPKGELNITQRLGGSAHVVLVLADFSQGGGGVPWVGLAQPAVYLHLQGFDVVWAEIPSFGKDVAKYLKQGAALILNIVRQFMPMRPHVMARGLGGGVFVQALTSDPEVFGGTHMVCDIQFPRGNGVLFEGDSFQKMLSYESTQVWLTYAQHNTTGLDDGTVHAQQLLVQSQGELQKLRKGSNKSFDELLITGGLIPGGHAAEVKSEGHRLFSFSQALLASIRLYFSRTPFALQQALQSGLVVEKAFQTKKQKKQKQENVDPAISDSAVDQGMVDEIVAKFAHRQKSFQKSRDDLRSPSSDNLSPKSVQGAHKSASPKSPALETNNWTIPSGPAASPPALDVVEGGSKANENVQTTNSSATGRNSLLVRMCSCFTSRGAQAVTH